MFLKQINECLAPKGLKIEHNTSTRTACFFSVRHGHPIAKPFSDSSVDSRDLINWLFLATGALMYHRKYGSPFAYHTITSRKTQKFTVLECYEKNYHVIQDKKVKEFLAKDEDWSVYAKGLASDQADDLILYLIH